MLTPSELGGKLALSLAYTAVAAVKAQRTAADLRCTPGALQTLHGEPAGAAVARLLGGVTSRPGLQGLRCADWPRSAWTRLAPYVYLVRMTQGELVLWPGQEVVSWGLVLEGELERMGTDGSGGGERLLPGDLVGEAAMLYDGAHVEVSAHAGTGGGGGGVRVKSQFALLAFTHGAALPALAVSHAPVAEKLLHKAMQLHLRRFGLPLPGVCVLVLDAPSLPAYLLHTST